MIKNMMKDVLRLLLFLDGDLLLGKVGEEYYLYQGEQSFQLSDHPYEPCLYVKSAQGSTITVHNSFTLDELCRVAKTNGTVRMITGDEYDMRGVCMLLRKALALSMESVDVGYLEGWCFMDYLEECGATSERTALPLTGSGIGNPNVMKPFLHSKKVKRTSDARYYIVLPSE